MDATYLQRVVQVPTPTFFRTRPRASEMSVSPVYELKIVLEGSSPPIWRRLQVPALATFEELHHVIQIAMGWDDQHLHQFRVGSKRIGVPRSSRFGSTTDERHTRLYRVLAREGDSLAYEYDFGDGWCHEVTLEGIHRPESEVVPIVCLGGARACPPEDSGGIWGYQDFLDAFDDSAHPHHERAVEWLGDDFDPEAFDCDRVNRILGAMTLRKVAGGSSDQQAKAGRNEPCPCGSGKKYKQCHLRQSQLADA
jgi:hypothetical protein